MSIFKKTLALLLVIALTAAIAVSGTLAYLQDEKSDVNVMTLGSVKIKQHEYQRQQNADGTYVMGTGEYADSYLLEGFKQNKPLLPIVGDPNEPGNSPAYAGYDNTVVRMTQVDSYGTMQVFAGKNAQDKFVTVENTGKSNAYVRTIVAIEVGSTDGSLIRTSARADKTHNGDQPWKSTNIGGKVNINGNNYRVVEYLYLGAKLSGGTWRHENGVLPAEDTTYPSLCQVYLKHNATNEDMIAIDGNGNGMLDILVLSQAVQVEGFADAQTALDTAFGKTAEKAAEWFGGIPAPIIVSSATELQTALDNATNGTEIIFGADITGDVTATQKADTKITINGNDNELSGTITVDGKSARYETTGLTIKNVNFTAASITADAYINLGKEGDSNTRYTNNVTVENCTFSYTGTGDVVAIKSYTGGDWNLVVNGCTVNDGMHSMVQVTNVEKGLTITDCKVYSKNGINLNNTPYLNMSDCAFDTTGYCVRIGVNGSTNNGNFTIANSTLKSANDDGDAVIIFRGTMNDATLTLTNTTLTAMNGELTSGNAKVVKN